MSTDNLDLDRLREMERDLDRYGYCETTEAEQRALIEAARERDAVVEAVRGVHARVKFTEPSGTYLICATCTGSHEFGQEYYPCPTIRALDAAIRDGGVE